MISDNNIPEHLYYSETHEWYEHSKEEKGYGYIGITDYQQQKLGEIVEVIVNAKLNDTIEQGDVFGAIVGEYREVDLVMPLTGKIVSINEELDNDPEAIGYNPYDEGWIIRIKISDDKEMDYLVNSEEYSAYLYDF